MMSRLFSAEEISQFAAGLGHSYYYHNDHNSGHYCLNLENDRDRDLLCKLIADGLSTREQRIERLRPDTSQNGNTYHL